MCITGIVHKINLRWSVDSFDLKGLQKVKEPLIKIKIGANE